MDLATLAKRMDALEDAVAEDTLARAEIASERHESIEKALADLKAAVDAGNAGRDAIAALTEAIKAMKPPAVKVAPAAVENRVEVPPAQVVVQPAPQTSLSAEVKFSYEMGRISGATITFKRG